MSWDEATEQGPLGDSLSRLYARLLFCLADRAKTGEKVRQDLEDRLSTHLHECATSCARTSGAFPLFQEGLRAALCDLFKKPVLQSFHRQNPDLFWTYQEAFLGDLAGPQAQAPREAAARIRDFLADAVTADIWPRTVELFILDTASPDEFNRLVSMVLERVLEAVTKRCGSDEPLDVVGSVFTALKILPPGKLPGHIVEGLRGHLEKLFGALLPRWRARARVEKPFRVKLCDLLDRLAPAFPPSILRQHGRVQDLARWKEAVVSQTAGTPTDVADLASLLTSIQCEVVDVSEDFTGVHLRLAGGQFATLHPPGGPPKLVVGATLVDLSSCCVLVPRRATNGYKDYARAELRYVRHWDGPGGLHLGCSLKFAAATTGQGCWATLPPVREADTNHR